MSGCQCPGGMCYCKMPGYLTVPIHTPPPAPKEEIPVPSILLQKPTWGGDKPRLKTTWRRKKKS